MDHLIIIRTLHIFVSVPINLLHDAALHVHAWQGNCRAEKRVVAFAFSGPFRSPLIHMLYPVPMAVVQS